MGSATRGIAQLVRSVGELLPDAKKIGARVVIENMLGYELVKDGNYERPLGRTVEEVLHIMSLVPREVDAAVDTNHIDNPELLISALGRRVRTIHVSDGDGRSECHELPGPGPGRQRLDGDPEGPVRGCALPGRLHVRGEEGGVPAVEGLLRPVVRTVRAVEAIRTVGLNENAV